MTRNEQQSKPLLPDGLSLSALSEFHEATAQLSKADGLLSMRAAISNSVLGLFGASAGLLVECHKGPKEFSSRRTETATPIMSGSWHGPASIDLLISECIHGRSAIFIESESALTKHCPDPTPRAPGATLRSCATIPMIVNSENIGALVFGFNFEKTFSPQLQSLMKMLASHCADALKRAYLYEEHVTIKERLSLAIEASEMGIWDYLPETKELTWSARIQEQYGLMPGTFLGTYEHYQSLVHPEDREFVNRTVENAITKRKSYTVIHRVIWPDQSVHWVQGRGKPYFDETGKLIRITGTSLSIDERKRFESELKNAIQSRDEFISIASHELKTPLTTIKLQTDIVKRMSLNDPAFSFASERVRKMIEQTDQQINRLSRLIDDMLDASRVSSGKLSLRMDRVDLSLLLNEVSSRFVSQFNEAKIAFQLNASSGICVHGDAYRLEQVLSNLYTNAIRYASGSRLETSARILDGCVEICVQDSGPGISEDAQKRIFSRFERADVQNKASGLGLGLYIAKEIVDGHQGDIEVKSALGNGSIFTIRLPVKPC